MNIPDAAIEAAAERLLAGIRERDDDAAALRFINGWVSSFREALAQEALDSIGDSAWRENAMWRGGVGHAARIVRGGTP